MSTTAGDIVKRALRLIGAIASGETPTADEHTDALTALNAMLQQWQIDRLGVYGITELTVNTLPTVATYTFGTGGDNATRPDAIDYVTLTSADGIDTLAAAITGQQYAAIAEKSVTGLPSRYWFNPTMPSATLTIYPVPGAIYTLTVGAKVQFSTYAAATALSLPPGYADAMAYNLALRIAPEYGKSDLSALAMMAQQTLATIKRANNRAPIVAQNEVAYNSSNSRNIGDITNGYAL